MYSSNQNYYGKSPPSAQPSAPPSAPPPAPYSYGQPPATGIPIKHPTTPASWSTGLCDCFSDFPNCCLTCWCPCITFGQIAEIVDQGSTSCGTSGALYALLSFITGCGCIYSCFYRSKMRNQYMLAESPCGDCLVHCCCETCALCQEYRELRNRGFDMSLGWQGNVERRQNGGVGMAPIPPQGGMTR